MNYIKQFDLKCYILTAVLAVFFILSGVGKILDVAAFHEDILAYGVPSSFSLIAVIIPPMEIILGLFLLYQGNKRSLLQISLLSLVVFTLAFTYAYFYKDVTDCGCFGKIRILKTSPILSFVRNGVFLLLNIYLLKKSEIAGQLSMTKAKWWAFACVSACAFMVSGISSQKPIYIAKPSYLNKNISDIELGEFVNISDDSTYLLFVYSPSCSQCWDAIENVKGYKQSGIVDEIIGLTYGDELSLMEFNERFEPNFQSIIIEEEKLKGLVNNTPTVFVIKNSQVVNIQVENIVSAATFNEYGL